MTEKTAEEQFAEARAQLRGEVEKPTEPVQAEPTETADPPESAPNEATPDEFDFNALPEPARKWLEAEREKSKKEADEVKAELDRQKRDYFALHNRLAPTQRRLAELEAHATPKAQAEPAKPAPTDSDYFDSDEWKTFARDFPEDARHQRKAIESQQRRWEAQLAELRDNNAKLAERIDRQIAPRLAEVDQYREHAIRRQEREALDAAHPSWSKLSGVWNSDTQTWDGEDPKFGQWVAEMSERFPIYEHARHSPNAREVIWLFDQFEKDQKLAELQMLSQASAEAIKKQQTREGNLAKSVAPNLGPTPAASRAQPMNEEEAFAAHLAHIRQQRKRA